MHDLSQTNRMRKPTKGLRIRLRIELRRLGVVGKFRTDELRNRPHALLVRSAVLDSIPITEFDGYKVLLRKED